MIRIKAIYSAIKHGMLPWWCYEEKKHYDCSYLAHLCINLRYAWRWITFQEYESDVEFEKQTNL